MMEEMMRRRCQWSRRQIYRGERCRRTHPPSPRFQFSRQHPHTNGGGGYAGAQVGNRNPGTLEGEGAAGIIKLWEILEIVFLGDHLNGLKKLSRLAILWTIHNWRAGIA